MTEIGKGGTTSPGYILTNVFLNHSKSLCCLCTSHCIPMALCLLRPTVLMVNSKYVLFQILLMRPVLSSAISLYLYYRSNTWIWIFRRCNGALECWAATSGICDGSTASPWARPGRLCCWCWCCCSGSGNPTKADCCRAALTFWRECSVTISTSVFISVLALAYHSWIEGYVSVYVCVYVCLGLSEDAIYLLDLVLVVAGFSARKSQLMSW